MRQRYVVTTLFVFLAMVVCLTNVQAQILPPIVAPSIALKGALTDGGKVQLAWQVLTRDTVKYYYIYRAAFPDTAKYSRIDSVTRTEYTDLPPRLATTNVPVSYVYYVTGTTTKGVLLKSNMIVVIILPPPPPKDIVQITSTPVESGEINIAYKYQVKAVSSDASAKLTYSLNTKPNGMTIDSTGLVKWTPTERGFPVVEVAVKSNKSGSATQRFTIRVAGGSGIVLGSVTDTTGTKPIGQVVVRLLKVGIQPDLTTSFDYKAVTDASGKYNFDGVDPGSYYVRAEPMNGDYLAEWYDGAASQQNAKTVLVSNNASTVVNFTLQSRYKPVYYTVKGNVIDSASHAPLKDAAVNFALAGFALNGSRGFAADPSLAQDFRGMFDFNQSLDHRLDGTAVEFVFKARTDSMGRFTLQLPQGSFVAYAEAKGHLKIFYKQRSNLLLADTIRVSGPLEAINFNLPPLPAVVLGEINGTITDSTTARGVRSRVIAFRELWATSDNPMLKPPTGAYIPGAYVVDTDSLGKYTIPNVLSGQYYVLAVPMGSYAPAYYSTSGSTQIWSKASRVAVNGNVVAGIDITVKLFVKPMVGYTFVSGTVTTSSGMGRMGKTSESVGVIGAIVYAVNANGTVYGYDVTDERGSYAIAGAAPGSYTLFVDAPGFASSSSMIASPSYATDLKGTAVGASGVNFSLNTVVTSVEENLPLVPSGYVLEQNYPNPFNPTTQILFSLPNNERVSLTIYNLIGQKMAELVNGIMSAGSHVVTWNGKDSRGLQLPSGVYFYRLESPGFTAAKRMLMLK
jgi:hypothetical protein